MNKITKIGWGIIISLLASMNGFTATPGTNTVYSQNFNSGIGMVVPEPTTGGDATAAFLETDTIPVGGVKCMKVNGTSTGSSYTVKIDILSALQCFGSIASNALTVEFDYYMNKDWGTATLEFTLNINGSKKYYNNNGGGNITSVKGLSKWIHHSSSGAALDISTITSAYIQFYTFGGNNTKAFYIDNIRLSTNNANTCTNVKPEKPTGLSVLNLAHSSLTLNWTDAASNEDNYGVVQKQGSGAWTSLTNSLAANTTTYNVTSLTANTSYTFGVFAKNTTGSSDTVSVNATTLPAPTIPASASGLTTSDLSHNSVKLNWTDNSNNETKFIILKKDGTSWVKVDSTASNITTFLVSGLTPSTQYNFGVLAKNDVGVSTDTVKVAFTTNIAPAIAPAAPTGFKADTVSNVFANLSWTDNSTTEDNFVLLKKDGNAWVTLKNDILPNTTSYSLTGLSEATDYTLGLLAKNTVGSSTDTAKLSFTTKSKPALPTNFAATNIYYDTLKLSWTDNANNEDSIVILSKTGTGKWSKVSTLGPNTVSCTSKKLSINAAYTFGIVFRNKYGVKDTVAVNATTLDLPVAKHKVVELTFDDGVISDWGMFQAPTLGSESTIVKAGKSLKVSSTSANYIGADLDITTKLKGCYGNGLYYMFGSTYIPAAVASSDGKIDIVLAYKITGGAEKQTYIMTTAPSAGDTWIDWKGYANITWLQDPNLEYVKVRAYSYKLKTPCTWYVDNIILSTDIDPTCTAPAAPTGLASSQLTNNSVLLTWTDNSNNETGFNVYKNGVLAQTVAANVTQYSATGLTESTSYGFVVKANNGAGETASNELSVTTPAAGTLVSLNNLSKVLVSPNPVKDVLYIKAEKSIQWIILNAEGIKVMAGSQSKVNVSDLKSGVYFIQLTDGNNLKTIKLIKQQ